MTTNDSMDLNMQISSGSNASFLSFESEMDVESSAYNESTELSDGHDLPPVEPPPSLEWLNLNYNEIFNNIAGNNENQIGNRITKIEKWTVVHLVPSRKRPGPGDGYSGPVLKEEILYESHPSSSNGSGSGGTGSNGSGSGSDNHATTEVGIMIETQPSPTPTPMVYCFENYQNKTAAGTGNMKTYWLQGRFL